jgi:hypothetical protein
MKSRFSKKSVLLQFSGNELGVCPFKGMLQALTKNAASDGKVMSVINFTKMY